MSKAIVCDRCGKIFDYKHESKTTVSLSHYVLGVTLFTEEYDLCPDCIEKFKHFIKNETRVG